MAEEFGLHPLAVEDARKGHQRPKIEEYDDSLFVVLHTVEPDADASDDDAARRRGRHLRRPATTSCRSATGRRRASPTCARAASASRSCCGIGSGFVLYALMDAVVDRYFPILDELESALEHAEEPDVRRRLDARPRSRSSTR